LNNKKSGALQHLIFYVFLWSTAKLVVKGAIKGSGEVVCLLAGGFGSLPSGNLPLLQKAVKTGLFLATYPYDVPVRSFSYERRNKLLAALSSGVLVLGAGEKSGALITAKYAKSFQKPIFALPYPPLNSVGVGCNGLIKQGARLTETEKDVLDFYGLEAKPREEIALTEQERKIYEYLKEKGEGHLTEISSAVSLPTFRATAVLSALEMKGLVVKLGGNRFSI
jgi:DNA processing protein